MTSDSLGNPVTLYEPTHLSVLNDFVEGLIACEARVIAPLAVAETDHSPLLQAYAAALHMFAESPTAPANAQPYLARALAGAHQVSPREQRFIAAIAAWVAGDIAQAIRLHQEQAQEFPRDLASLKLGQYHCFNQGQTPAMLKLALSCLPASADVAYVHGMAAFGWEQCHLLPRAEAAAQQALRMNRKEPWAQHALAHVQLTQGRLHEGLAFMREVSPTWVGLNSFMQTHNWWHLALFALELGQHDEALRLCDEQVWGVVPEYSQDQIGAVSLLARLELAGADVGARWQALLPFLSHRVNDQVLPFLDLHYLYGLARAESPLAASLLANITAFAQNLPEAHPAKPVWHAVALPAAQGLLAHARGDYARAVLELGSALPRLLEIGGSHAQRDLFEQIHLDALLKCGQWNGAQHRVQQSLNAQPESMRLAALARRVYAGLELTEFAT